jgi:rieske iron-sulfur protein
MTIDSGEQPQCPGRRALLRVSLVVAGCGLAASATRAATESARDPRKLPPRAGDELAHASGPRQGEPVRAADIAQHAAPILAYPRDPQAQVVRDASRLNQVLLLRFAVDELDEATRAGAADGIVAYSGICTHAACGISEWDTTALRLVCPCHGSAFDPRQRGRRVAGPAPRALPVLPLTQMDGRLLVKGPFTARVGMTQS